MLEPFHYRMGTLLCQYAAQIKAWVGLWYPNYVLIRKEMLQLN